MGEAVGLLSGVSVSATELYTNKYIVQWFQPRTAVQCTGFTDWGHSESPLASLLPSTPPSSYPAQTNTHTDARARARIHA